MTRGALHAAFLQMACVPTLVGGLPLLGSLLEFLRHSDGLRMQPHAFLHFARWHPKARVLRLSLGPRPDMLLVLDPVLDVRLKPLRSFRMNASAAFASGSHLGPAAPKAPALFSNIDLEMVES
jgi:hypothetical protein